MLRSDSLPRTAHDIMTTSDVARYAIYFAPEEYTPLAHFGRTWFGHDPENTEAVVERRYYGLGEDTAKRITEKPAHYGFHATLKAPFRLGEQSSESALRDDLAAFASIQKPVTLRCIKLAERNGQIVLSLNKRNHDIDNLASDCVARFDHHRAPINAQDRARRNLTSYTDRQRELFERWGYPFVFEEYDFHMTLTGVLPPKELAQVIPALAPALKDATLDPMEIKSVCLFADTGEERPFRLIERFPFGG